MPVSRYDQADADACGHMADRTLFTSGEGEYHTYRIPALLTATDDVVLAFCEGRQASASDHGDVDLLCRRSTDGGRTWEPPRVVYADVPWTAVTDGNPCPVLDGETGTVWLPFCRDNRDVLVTASVDAGRSWTDPVPITATAKAPAWTWYATGPGVGIQLRHGEHAGRLVIPCDHGGRDVSDGHRPDVSYSHMLYSDDHGQTWHRGEPIHPHANECQVVERADGSLLVNMRNHLGHRGGQPDRAGRRLVATSADGGETWSDVRLDEALVEPACQASMITASPDNPGDTVLFANPADEAERHKMTLRRSDDGGETWTDGIVIHEGPAGYSSMTMLPDRDVGILYERGEENYRETLAFERVALEDLT